MPVNLAARCILFSTNEGDTVLDPFNGSGTTGTACIKLGRNFIGVERESEYVKLARIRWANFIDANVPPKKTNGLQGIPHSPLV